MSWLFVPVETGPSSNKVQDQLQYAAVKAHTTRNAHRRRRTTHGTISTSRKRMSNLTTLDLQASLFTGQDPFDSLHIEASPMLDRALAFVRFYHEASWLPPHMANPKPSSRKHRRRKGQVPLRVSIPNWLWDLFLTDSGTFCSVVASVVPVMRKFVPEADLRDVERLSLELKANGLSRLRQGLQRSVQDFVPSMALVYHVKALFREASMNGDLGSAADHARMLAWLVDKMPPCQGFESTACRIALFGDAIPALLQLRRPICDYQHWMPPLVQAVWSAAGPILENLSSFNARIPDCIQSLSIRNAIEHGSRVLQVQHDLGCTIDGCNSQDSELLFQWMITRAEHHVCSLLTLLFDLDAMAIQPSLSSGARHTEIALALALLHTYQKSFCCILREDGVDMHESAGAIYASLLHQVQRALLECTEEERISYKGVHFWLLFVGARAEERSQGWTGNTKAKQAGERGAFHNQWFRHTLVRCAVDNGLQTWADARSMLLDIIFSDTIAPSPEEWYHQLFERVEAVAST